MDFIGTHYYLHDTQYPIPQVSFDTFYAFQQGLSNNPKPTRTHKTQLVFTNENKYKSIYELQKDPIHIKVDDNNKEKKTDRYIHKYGCKKRPGFVVLEHPGTDTQTKILLDNDNHHLGTSRNKIIKTNIYEKWIFQFEEHDLTYTFIKTTSGKTKEDCLHVKPEFYIVASGDKTCITDLFGPYTNGKRETSLRIIPF